jgi:sulfite reductase (NADPH) flavoprotein alpha-component
MTWRHFLLWEANLNKSTAALWRAAGRGDCTREQLEQTVVDGLLSGTPQELAGLLGPLLPRFYSIASSPVCHPHEIHLTLAITELSLGGVNYPGVCSHYLAEQLQLGDQFEVTLKSVDHFTLPNDPNVPIIMVGPGTGIAPYRGFMQERHATDAPGANWLFFGERQRASDFFYQDFWTQLEQQNRLRLDLAFSRDQAHKIYVQHRMLERGEELWQWLQQGAILYVCGDAKRMAPEVEATLHQIAQHHGKMDAQAAFGYLKTLRREKRYLRDVY